MKDRVAEDQSRKNHVCNRTEAANFFERDAEVGPIAGTHPATHSRLGFALR
jgi:hypothetical protein